MAAFFGALQFLTILRFKKDADTKALGASSAYFPLVGAFLGVLLIGLNAALRGVLPAGVINLILVTVLIILTGGLHLDGLADTFDALASGKDRDEMLRIMRDSHKGTFGVLALIMSISFKIGLLSAMPQGLKEIGIFLMMVLSRYSINLSLFFFPYARREGKAKIFFQTSGAKAFVSSTLITLVLMGLTFNCIAPAIFFTTMIVTLSMNVWIKKLLGGLTGDTLGALVEINEIIVLFSLISLSRIIPCY